MRNLPALQEVPSVSPAFRARLLLAIFPINAVFPSYRLDLCVLSTGAMSLSLAEFRSLEEAPCSRLRWDCPSIISHLYLSPVALSARTAPGQALSTDAECCTTLSRQAALPKVRVLPQGKKKATEPRLLPGGHPPVQSDQQPTTTARLTPQLCSSLRPPETQRPTSKPGTSPKRPAHPVTSRREEKRLDQEPPS
ncbi:unnamed protein product [Rangifer tarandus platyrhynchus]|uniref:Uncharacterized protein n=1 Tax=Rangifer tarandus platyrhynchus TaxID=3082113 RepID=A0AC59ZMA7_RANTA